MSRLHRIACELDALAGPGRGDPEADHSEGDALLLEAIRLLGYDEIADAFERARRGWWYA